jgi:hypothetical protein
MNATLRLTHTDEMECSITISGTLAQFKKLAALIQKHETPMHWPLGTVNRAISDTIRKAEQEFRTECDEPVAM